MEKEWLERDRFETVRGYSDVVASYLDWTTSNQLTLFRIILTLPMTYFFFQGNLLIGCIFYTHCCLLDFFDGAVARYQEERRGTSELTSEVEEKMTYLQIICFRGKTEFGKQTDAFSDKCVYFAVLLALGQGFISWWLIILSLIPAILLTSIRLKKVKKFIQHFWPQHKDSSSNRLGKFKMWLEIVAITILVFIPRTHTGQMMANFSVGIAMLFGFLSFAGQIYTIRRGTKHA